VPFVHIPTDQPGPNPKGPSQTITVPTWAGPPPTQDKGQVARSDSMQESNSMSPGQSLASVWSNTEVDRQAVADSRADATSSCSILPDYFYYTWGRNRPNNSVAQLYAPSTAGCCDLCANHTGCQVRSPKLAVGFSQPSYIFMTYRVVGARRGPITKLELRQGTGSAGCTRSRCPPPCLAHRRQTTTVET
jgi:hypothetical protein